MGAASSALVEASRGGRMRLGSMVKLDRRREMIARACRSVGEGGGQRLLQRGCGFGAGRHKGGGVRAAQWLDGTGRGRRAA
jgi:hypothetical protein